MQEPDLAQFGLTLEQYNKAKLNQQQRTHNMKFMWGYAPYSWASLDSWQAVSWHHLLSSSVSFGA